MIGNILEIEYEIENGYYKSSLIEIERGCGLLMRKSIPSLQRMGWCIKKLKRGEILDPSNSLLHVRSVRHGELGYYLYIKKKTR